MAGKEGGPSKANGVTKPDDKGKGKVGDVKDRKHEQEKKGKDPEGKRGEDEKLLPPGTRA
jgi:hypothetical protein